MTYTNLTLQVFAANFEFVHAVKIDLPPFLARHMRVHGMSTNIISLQLEIFGAALNGKVLFEHNVCSNADVS